MKKILFIAICFLSLQFTAFYSLAQTPVSGTVWLGTGPSTVTSTDPSTFTTLPATIIPGATSVNVSQWSRSTVTGVAAGACYNSATWDTGVTSSLAGSQADVKYIYFTITNDAATELEVTNVFLNSQVSSTGPRSVQMLYAIGAGADQTFGSSLATLHSASPETFSFTGVAHICPGQTATFKLYAWGGTHPNGTLRLNDNSSITATFVVGPVTASASNNTNAFFPLCAGSEVDLTSFAFSGLAPYTYSWSGPSSYTSTDANPIILPAAATAAGDYTLTVTDAYGCPSLAALTTVYITPGPDTTMTISGSLAFCTPSTVTFTVPFDVNNSYTWYDVSSGTPVIVSAGTNTYTAASSGQYYVDIINMSSGCEILSTTYTVTATTTPTATITPAGPVTVCSPSTVSLSTTSGVGYTYQWYDVSGAIAGATNATYVATVTGVYHVTIVNGTCSATSTNTTVTVNTSPVTPVVTPAGPITVCSGSAITLTSTTQSGVTYKWWRTGVGIPGANTSTYGALVSGTYSMVVTNTTNTCTATSNGVVVTINPLPTSTITAAPGTTICAGNSVTLSTVSVPGNTYQWLDGNLPIAGATNATYVTSTAGTYRVIVTRTATGCFDTTAAPGTTLTVQPAPSLSDAVISSAGPFTICSNDSVVLSTPNTTSGLTYQWYQPLVVAGATNYKYTARTTGTYTVKITNAAGCSVTSALAVSVTVNAAPSAAVTTSGSTTFCTGGSVAITAAVGAGYTYQWYNAAGPIPGETNSSYTATTSGTYHAVVTSPAACQTTSSSTTVTVIPAPYIVVTGSPSFCAGNNILLSISTAGIPGVIYQWKRNGVNIPGAVSATYVANVAGDYTCFVNIPGSCSVLTAATTITVFATLFPTVTFDGTYFSTYNTYATYQWYINTVTIPGATTYRVAAYTNGSYRVMVTDTNGCQLLSAEYPVYNLAVDNVNGTKAISIYPNPATSSVHVAAATEVKVVISTVEGKLILEGNSKNDIDVSALSAGLYMISVYDEQGNRLHVEKLIKQ